MCVSKNEQDGVFITMNGIVGYFLGISMEFIGHYQWPRLRLLAMSELEAWRLVDGYVISARHSEKDEDQTWGPYRRWAYNLADNLTQQSTIRDDHYRVYNVMLVQKRGKFHERVAVGQIDKVSWNEENPLEEAILLV